MVSWRVRGFGLRGPASRVTIATPPMTPRRLIVNWRHEPTRGIMPVAELITTRPPAEPCYEFGYVEGVRRAIALGFEPFLAFPHLHRRYRDAQLFPFFRNRTMPSTRPDYVNHVEALGLSVQTADVVDLLGRSEGRRLTDRLETVLAAERDPRTGRYVTRCLLRGIKHVPGAEVVIDRMWAGSELSATLEPDNVRNPRARQLRFEGTLIGYVADYLLPDLDALEAAGSVPRFVVERINPPPCSSRHRVLLRVDAAWPVGFEPFGDPAFAPYRSDASSLPMVG
jgi:hypothetical protein